MIDNYDIKPVAKPLAGIRVVELAKYMTATQGCALLADLGAEVIKVDTPGDDPSRFAGGMRYGEVPYGRGVNPWFDAYHQNEAFMCLNIRTEEGREILDKLIATADIFITNYREGGLKKLGLDYNTLHEKYPALPYVHFTAYGDKGPEREFPGYDYTTALARGGIQTNITPKGCEQAPYWPATFFDTAGGMATAIAALSLINESRATGFGDYAVCSLLQTCLHLQRWNIFDWQYGFPFPYDGFAPIPTCDMYQCGDGRWVSLCIVVIDPLWNKLMEALERPDLIDHPIYSKCQEVGRLNLQREVHDELAASFKKFPAKEIAAKLTSMDLSCQVCATYEEVVEDVQVVANNFLPKITYEDGSEFINVDCLIDTPLQEKAPFHATEDCGASNAKYLKEVGYSDADIERLKNEGIAPVLVFDPLNNPRG